MSQDASDRAGAGSDDTQHENVGDEIRLDYDRLFDMSIDMMCVAGFDGYFKKLNPS